MSQWVRDRELRKRLRRDRAVEFARSSGQQSHNPYGPNSTVIQDQDPHKTSYSPAETIRRLERDAKRLPFSLEDVEVTLEPNIVHRKK